MFVSLTRFSQSYSMEDVLFHVPRSWKMPLSGPAVCVGHPRRGIQCQPNGMARWESARASRRVFTEL